MCPWPSTGRRVVEALKLHKAKHVVGLKLDRLFRDAADALAQTRAWDKAGIALHLCDMGGGSVDTSGPDSTSSLSSSMV